MDAYWSGLKDEECDDLEAKITTCVLNNNSINILFKGVHDDESFQGRISLSVTNEKQMQDGVWIYPDTIKEAARFSEKQIESEEVLYKATVTGKLNNFRGKKVSFIGVWDDKKWNKEDGCIYEFEIDAEIA
ncbi:MAG: hypothetical protein KAT06_04035 [Gammaproteobacteria bacterium]|nr:hypothetical protein [Gammaproteobacteria bacterium]